MIDHVIYSTRVSRSDLGHDISVPDNINNRGQVDAASVLLIPLHNTTYYYIVIHSNTYYYIVVHSSA